jgi:hypothetical protein
VPIYGSNQMLHIILQALLQSQIPQILESPGYKVFQMEGLQSLTTQFGTLNNLDHL